MDSSLDQADYDRLFELLEPGSSSPESAFQLCRLKLMKFFSWRWCPDPANLADETIMRLLKNVKQGQILSPEMPYKYVYAIALNVYREYRREIKRHQLVPFDEAISTSVPESSDSCRDWCLGKLPNEKLDLLNQYYQFDREELAEKLELSLNALRLRIHRIKEELRNCCEDCQKRSLT